jgi:hypothetical protein
MAPEASTLRWKTSFLCVVFFGGGGGGGVGGGVRGGVRAQMHYRLGALNKGRAEDSAVAGRSALTGIPAQRQDALLNARPAAITQPDDRHPIAKRAVLKPGDLARVRLRKRPPQDREVLGKNERGAPVDGAAARDDAVAREAGLGVVHAEIAAAVLGEASGLDVEGAWVEEGVDALAGGELMASVLLSGDARGAASGAGSGTGARDRSAGGGAGRGTLRVVCGVGRGCCCGCGCVEESRRVLLPRRLAPPSGAQEQREQHDDVAISRDGRGAMRARARMDIGARTDARD